MSEPAKYYASRYNDLLYRVNPDGTISCGTVHWRDSEVFQSIESINVLLRNGVIVRVKDPALIAETKNPADH